jgi:gliding motility-associated lipoprotein GldH
MKERIVVLLILLASMFSACKNDHDYVIYHKFNNQVWKRFNYLQFELPIETSKDNYDVSFFAHITKEYEYNNLDFNMIMTTPSGEERIKEYHIDIKKKEGTFLGSFVNDSCEYTIPLKKGLNLSKGVLTLQLENLIPRLETTGILGVGVRLHRLR